MKREKIVVIEDEADILEIIEYNLLREGFEVGSARNGDAGLNLVMRENPTLVLLDLMLPGLDGIEVFQRLKADPLTASIPIIMVTAKGEESERVLGLRMGADDYIVKPFSPLELVARVKAVLRRGPPKQDRDTARGHIVRAGLSIDTGRHEVKVNGASVKFTATELRLLHFLAAHTGRVFTRDHLLARVIGENAIVVDRNIDVHIRSIRKKIGPYRNLIETVRGVGYRFREAD